MSVPALTEIPRLNAKAGLSNLVGVFFGGTSGIGEYTAKALVRHTQNPTVYIVGRNKEAGERILRELSALRPDSTPNLHFLQHDLSLLSEVDAAVQRIVASESKLNLVMFSANNLSLKGTRTNTKEGLDARFALMYYSRWRAISELQPLLHKAALTGESARALSVLDPGNGHKVDLDDPDLKHNYSFLNANKQAGQFNSLATRRFARVDQEVAYIHTFPGFVQTNIGQALPWYLRPLLAVGASLAGISAEESGERHLYIGAVGERYAKGSHLVGAKLEDLSEKNEAKGFLTTDLQDKVWEHTEEMFRRAAAGNA